MKQEISLLSPGQGDVKLAGSPRGFGGRFPSLVATGASGVVAALMTREFGVTFEVSIVLTGMMTVILGLPEAVAAQSLTQSVKDVSGGNRGGLCQAYGEELRAASLLGLACALAVGLVAWVLTGLNLRLAISVALTGFTSVFAAGLYGILVPRALIRLGRRPDVFAPAVCLAITDLTTLVVYLSMTTFMLITC